MSEETYLANAASDVLTKKLNDGFKKIANGSLKVYMPFKGPHTSLNISRYFDCNWVAYYPPADEDFSAFEKFMIADSLVDLKKFAWESNPADKIDTVELAYINGIVAHVNESMFGSDGIIPRMHKLVEETQFQFGEFTPYRRKHVAYSPDSMRTPKSARNVLLALTKKLQAML